MADLQDVGAFVAVARHGGFREAARKTGSSPSQLSEAVRRLEAGLGVRLLHRTTRSVAATDAGQRLLEQLTPALDAVETALDVVNGFRDRPAGRLRLNVPASASKLVLPRILPPFHKAYPDITVEVIVDDSFVDLLRSGCDAGIRYGERMEQDMVATPIGPRRQRFALAASPPICGTRHAEKAGRPAAAYLPARPLFQRRHAAVGVRAQGQEGVDRAQRPADRQSRRGGRLEGRGGGGRRRAGVPVRGLAAALLRAASWCRCWSAAGRHSTGRCCTTGRRYLPAPLRAFVDFIQAMRW
jgi:DNA-binding transcriptional LysR family regulator